MEAAALMKDSLAVRVNQLSKKYHAWFRPSVMALSGVSFEVPQGQIFGLLGPNGAGKTTIIKILLGIVRASSGSASLLGHAAGKRRGRRRVGYLPENLQLGAHQNANTALEYFGRLSNMSHADIRSRGEMLLKKVGLAARKKEPIKQYSKGMRQRLGLAQALLHQPELLILDEPTDGLDPVGRSQVRDIMRELKDQGCTVFLNSHLLQEVEMVCDHVAILSRGQLKYVGSVDDFTQADERFVSLEVLGTEHDVRLCLDRHTITSCGVLGEKAKVDLEIKGQSEVDAIVDALRQQQISVVSVTPHRNSLETMFLNLMSEEVYQA